MRTPASWTPSTSRHPQRIAVRRTHHQCGTVATAPSHRAALPAPHPRAGEGRFHQGLSGAARREGARLRGRRCSLWCIWRARPKPICKPSRNSCATQPLVRECWMLSGEIDFVLKCVAPDLKTFQGLRREAHRRAATCATSRPRSPCAILKTQRWYRWTTNRSVPLCACLRESVPSIPASDKARSA